MRALHETALDEARRLSAEALHQSRINFETLRDDIRILAEHTAGQRGGPSAGGEV